MAPPGSTRWKSSVKEVSERADKFSQNLKKIQEIQKINQKQEIFNNGQTSIGITVKTKKPSSSKANNWSSILSENNDTSEAEHFSRQKLPQKRKTKRDHSMPSNSKKLETKTSKTHDEIDAKLQNQENIPSGSHRFSQRTLQIFLKEMRLAIEHNDSKQLGQILGDLEFVASNLEPGQQISSLADESKIDVAFHKTEAKKAKEDCALLRRSVYKLEQRNQELVSNLETKECKIKELTSAVKKLTDNGNKMMRTLTSMADIEEKFKISDRAMKKAQQDLAAERFKISQMELKKRASELEIGKLRTMMQ